MYTDIMKTLKQQVKEYLEAQRAFYGDEEVKNSLEVLAIQNEHLSDMWIFHKMLILRLIDNSELYFALETAFTEQEL
jgi:hypothetical protein